MKKPSSTQKQKRSRPELAIYPRRWRVIITFALCLVVFGLLSATIISIFLTSTDLGTEALFICFYLICAIYLLGIAWSALRLLISKQPSLQANGDGLILRHLPFLGNVTISWSEVKSIHVARSILVSHLCIVPQDAPELIHRYGLLRFALNASARLGRRVNAPLSISQAALDQPIALLAERIEQDYGILYTPGLPKKQAGEITQQQENE
ncbi:MAG TPA: hypothetical protein VKV19_16595 [Ktedonobacteraceae bacterium]|nr:hypothetical protein [Ktedonobacteraceae bacterium]